MVNVLKYLDLYLHESFILSRVTLISYLRFAFPLFLAPLFNRLALDGTTHSRPSTVLYIPSSKKVHLYYPISQMNI
jgi:hypothetical protein